MKYDKKRGGKSAVAALLALSLFAPLAFAQDSDLLPSGRTKYVDPNPWTHKTPRLDRDKLDKLLGHPEKLLFIDLRRPDELTKLGSFPVYLSVQSRNLPESLEYIPKGRAIVTVSNRAHRAGDAGDILLAHGYKVVGAIGVLDYEDEGGSLLKVTPPPPQDAQPAAAARGTETQTQAGEKK